MFGAIRSLGCASHTSRTVLFSLRLCQPVNALSMLAHGGQDDSGHMHSHAPAESPAHSMAHPSPTHAVEEANAHARRPHSRTALSIDDVLDENFAGMTHTTKALVGGVLAHDRATLARSITLAESSVPEHQRQARMLLASILQRTTSGKARPDTLPRHLPTTFRVGISGPPGSGKSTFIEALGKYLTSKSLRVAVLAVDPSSTRTGGSILGDKTRMTELSRDPLAYVRPSPSRGTLGGVAKHTSEAIVLCEAAGYEVVLIETVGVGQSETMVADMVDAFALLVPPAGGDELQGIKKGIVELADIVIVNKSDGELEGPARKTHAEYTSALKLLRPPSELWTPRVTRVSSLTGVGVAETWGALEEYYSALEESGEIHRRRCDQRRLRMYSRISDELMVRFHDHALVRRVLPQAERRVMAGLMTPATAADHLLSLFIAHPEDGLPVGGAA